MTDQYTRERLKRLVIMAKEHGWYDTAAFYKAMIDALDEKEATEREAEDHKARKVFVRGLVKGAFDLGSMICYCELRKTIEYSEKFRQAAAEVFDEREGDSSEYWYKVWYDNMKALKENQRAIDEAKGFKPNTIEEFYYNPNDFDRKLLSVPAPSSQEQYILNPDWLVNLKVNLEKEESTMSKNIVVHIEERDLPTIRDLRYFEYITQYQQQSGVVTVPGEIGRLPAGQGVYLTFVCDIERYTHYCSKQETRYKVKAA